jgi:CRISPR-associated protein Csc3
MPDFSFLEYPDEIEPHQDISYVFEDYLKQVANKGLRLYKEYIHTSGNKRGQSLYSHVMDLISFVERLAPIVGLSDEELGCIFLALTVHDINKVPLYNRRPDGKILKYADVATHANIQQELGSERLNVNDFFPQWQEYLDDIVYLAHAHQAAATTTTLLFNQEYIDRTKFKSRLKGPLKYLMQAADVSDNSHSGDHRDPDEVHIRDRLITHINAVMERAGREYEYRFFGHRLAELRGVITNVMHNALVQYFQEKYGKESCIDLQYYPEGVNYLLDTGISLEWNEQTLREVAERVRQRMAELQLKKLEEFIKPRPAAIVVDDAAMSTGASLNDIFDVITRAVMRKQYKLEWHQQRSTSIRNDLEAALGNADTSVELKEQIASILQQPGILPDDETDLKRGEFLSAYRKFLEDHRADELKALKQDTWTRIYRLFGLPESHYALYQLVDPYRRGYFTSRDLPAISLNEMKDAALRDTAELDQQAAQAKVGKKAKKAKEHIADQPAVAESEEVVTTQFDVAYIVDYLKRNLEVWDSGENATSQPIMVVSFGDSLRQYANAKRPYEQCCHCGSALPAGEWMAAQVPANIGVQSFSNRLEGGSSREPKRNVCDVCRAQFILEKLAWRAHRDKQEMEQTTFYLHLFPYAYFTRPQLTAWWLSVERLRDADHSAFFLNTGDYFRTLARMQTDLRIQGVKTGINGLSIPVLSDTISNTPVLCIVAPGSNYGLQFLLALEKAVILVRWFECRAILSKSPVPPLNLAHEKTEEGEPVVLMVDGMPRNLSWLLPQTSIGRSMFDKVLVRKLYLLHQLSEKLYYVDPKSKDKSNRIPHDLATAAADDPLALYYEADRLIEKKIAAEKSKGAGAPELQAIHLSGTIAPILDNLIKL